MKQWVNPHHKLISSVPCEGELLPRQNGKSVAVPTFISMRAANAIDGGQSF
ncbi:hypothetical protein FHW03_003163 [Ochrobactrum sp. RH2CCR150]|nr:hypothetical protein [Ochrobactrum sp. RH2CCR150]